MPYAGHVKFPFFAKFDFLGRFSRFFRHSFFMTCLLEPFFLDSFKIWKLFTKKIFFRLFAKMQQQKITFFNWKKFLNALCMSWRTWIRYYKVTTDVTNNFYADTQKRQKVHSIVSLKNWRKYHYFQGFS